MLLIDTSKLISVIHCAKRFHMNGLGKGGRLVGNQKEIRSGTRKLVISCLLFWKLLTYTQLPGKPSLVEGPRFPRSWGRDEHYSHWPNRYFGTGTEWEEGTSSVFRYRYRRVLVPVLVPIPILVKVPTIGIPVKLPTISTFTETAVCIGDRYKFGEPVLVLLTSTHKGFYIKTMIQDTRRRGNALSFSDAFPVLILAFSRF